MRGDDLTDLLTAAPPGPSQPMSYRQGVIQTFNPVTLQNTVLVGGTVLTDVPILGVAEAASLSANSVVGLMIVGSTWAIIGRLVTPNTAEATDAITRLSQGVATAFVAASETTTSSTYTDLATAGPAVTLNVKASGKVLVFLGATIAVSPAAGALWGGFMNMDITGANVIGPLSIAGSLGYTIGAGASPDNEELSITRMIPLFGLTPGPTTFTAKYAVNSGSPGETARFRNRSIAVFAL